MIDDWVHAHQTIHLQDLKKWAECSNLLHVVGVKYRHYRGFVKASNSLHPIYTWYLRMLTINVIKAQHMSSTCHLWEERTHSYHSYILALGLVQDVSLLPLAVVALVGLADVELYLGALLVLHGLPLVQGHFLGSLVLCLLGFIFPSEKDKSTQCPMLWTIFSPDNHIIHTKITSRLQDRPTVCPHSCHSIEVY